MDSSQQYHYHSYLTDKETTALLDGFNQLCVCILKTKPCKTHSNYTVSYL